MNSGAADQLILILSSSPDHSLGWLLKTKVMSAGGEKAMWRRVVTVETVEMVNWTKQGKDMRDNDWEEEGGQRRIRSGSVDVLEASSEGGSWL